VELLLGERGKITIGLDLPVFMSNNLLEFLRNADLGKVDPSNPQSQDLKDVLYIVKTGISTRRILNKLVHIYASVNDMLSRDPIRPQCVLRIKSTPLMDRYFHNDYRKIPNFNPNSFNYLAFYDIILSNIESPNKTQYRPVFIKFLLQTLNS